MTGGPLTLTDTATTTITGPGANLLTVSGNNASNVFDIQGGSASVSGLTVTEGQARRGERHFYNQNGMLSLMGVVVTGNSAGYVGGGLEQFPRHDVAHELHRERKLRRRPRQ